MSESDLRLISWAVLLSWSLRWRLLDCNVAKKWAPADVLSVASMDGVQQESRVSHTTSSSSFPPPATHQ